MVKKEKIVDKRRALLNATLTLVNNHGFHNASMSKIAELAGVATATIYLYFQNKQDLINSLYLDVKASFSKSAFEGYHDKMSVRDGFELIWFNIANYKLTQIKESNFLSQCDNSPMVEERIRVEGLKNLQPLLDLWQRGRSEGTIKPISDYVLYAFTIYPLSFLQEMQERKIFESNDKILKETFNAAWDSIQIT